MGSRQLLKTLSHFLFPVLWLLGSSYSDNIVKPVSCTSNFSTTRCSETERSALLNFKEGLIDPSGRLSSWIGQDCCQWRGLSCSNRTGRVLKLDLRNPFQFSTYDYGERATYNRTSLGGEVTPSLLKLKDLIYLDLSSNDFNESHIPDFLGSHKNLRYLNLSFSSFSGVVPPNLGNLSNLQYLDLNAYSFSTQTCSKQQVDSLQWLSHLSSLKYLDMGCVNLERAGSNWLQAINMLPSLQELHLTGCGLVNLPLLSFSSTNFSSLSHLDLSYNQ